MDGWRARREEKGARGVGVEDLSFHGYKLGKWVSGSVCMYVCVLTSYDDWLAGHLPITHNITPVIQHLTVHPSIHPLPSVPAWRLLVKRASQH
jgi:hypothetical protein